MFCPIKYRLLFIIETTSSKVVLISETELSFSDLTVFSTTLNCCLIFAKISINPEFPTRLDIFSAISSNLLRISSNSAS